MRRAAHADVAQRPEALGGCHPCDSDLRQLPDDEQGAVPSVGYILWLHRV